MPHDTAQEEFKRQTPGAYKWAVGAGGLVVAATTALLAVQPETAAYSLSGLVLFILLIFVVISLEMGTAKLEDSNPLAKNARRQVTLLSWFATLAIVVGASAIISSILLRWPLDISLNENTQERQLPRVNCAVRTAIERPGAHRPGLGRTVEEGQVRAAQFL